MVIAALLLVATGCINEIDYDLSGAPDRIVVNAIWSSDEQEHIVYLSKSEAYRISPDIDTADVRCYVNGALKAIADSVWSIWGKDDGLTLCYRIKAELHPGDSVSLAATLPGHSLLASSVVPPAPEVSIDTVCTHASSWPFIPYRRYDISCTVKDIPGHVSYYRLYRPSVHVEGWWRHAGTLVDAKDFPYGLKIDETDPIFKNSSFYFPEMLSRDVTFVHSGLSNVTHVFPDDSFRNGTHGFSYAFDYNSFHPSGSYNLVKYTVRFRIGSLSEAEYLYLLAYNASVVSSHDPLSEPVSLPSNIEGGLGVFAVEGTYSLELHAPDMKYPPNTNGEIDPETHEFYDW